MDDRVREAQRAFRRTGLEADEAAWLRERLRVADVTPARLGLAAHCGHAAAASAAGVALPAPVTDHAGLRAWSDVLLVRWRGAYLRAMVAAERAGNGYIRARYGTRDRNSATSGSSSAGCSRRRTSCWRRAGPLGAGRARPRAGAAVTSSGLAGDGGRRGRCRGG